MVRANERPPEDPNNFLPYRPRAWLVLKRKLNFDACDFIPLIRAIGSRAILVIARDFIAYSDWSHHVYSGLR